MSDVALEAELAAALKGWHHQDLADLDACRKTARRMNPPYARSRNPQVQFTSLTLPRGDGSELGLRVVHPRSPNPNAPALVNVHGGGFCLGDPRYDDASNAQLVERTGAVIVSPEYRLAPEHPYPAGMQDCVLALTWLAGKDFPIPRDPERIAVMGSSAGGGLAAGAALWLRDHTDLRLVAQILLEPELDHRLATPSMLAGENTPTWFRGNAEWSWRYYLAGQEPDQYASPSLETNLAGLPKTYLWVNQVDPLRDEGLAYGMGLMTAGVPVEMHVWPSTCHGFLSLKHTAAAKTAMSELVRVVSSYV